MTTLRKFIAKKPKQRKEDLYVNSDTAVQNLQIEKEVKRSRSHELYLLYSALQRRHGRWIIPYRKDKRMRTCFRKLAKKLGEFTAMGINIDDIDYILAHKATYGSDLHPSHLISWCSLGIYQGYITSRNAEVIELTEDEERAYDEETLSYLSNIRGESREDVAALLMSCGLL